MDCDNLKESWEKEKKDCEQEKAEKDRTIEALKLRLKEVEQDAYWAKLELARQKAKDLAAKKLASIRLFLGLEYIPNDAATAVRVKTVRKSSPAEKAGLLVGDQILKIENYEVKSKEDFRRTLRNFKAGENLKFEVKRGLEILRYDVQSGYAGVSDTTVNRLKRLVQGAASDDEVMEFVANTKLYHPGGQAPPQPVVQIEQKEKEDEHDEF